MPNILDKITNTLNEHVADAKNIKGTYVVVNDYSALASLPVATVVEGSLAYCVNDYYNPLIPEEISNKLGFYQYDGSDWNIIHLGPIKIVLDKYDSSNFDITETYTWTGVDLYSILTDLLGITQNGGLIQVDFNDLSILFNYQGIADANDSVCSIILIYNNQQYIATLTSSSTGLTLSFQELQAGSGGGGSATKTIYDFVVKDNNTNNMRKPAEVYFSIDEDSLNEAIEDINAFYSSLATLQGETYTNLTDANSVKAMFDYYTANSLADAVVAALNILVIKSQKAYIYGWDFDAPRNMNINDYLMPAIDFIGYTNIYFTGEVRSVYDCGVMGTDGNNQTTADSIFESWFWSGSMIPGQGTSKPGFFTNSSSQTMTFTTRTESTGSGSGSSEATGGSGKLYELSMDLNLYDENGTKVNIPVFSNPISDLHNADTMTIKLCFYESNFERLKEYINNYIQTNSLPLSPLTDINSLVTMINTVVSETTATTTAMAYIFLSSIIQFTDKSYILADNDFYSELWANKYLAWSFNWCNVCEDTANQPCVANGGIGFLTAVGNDDGCLGIDANNSCTLTEYGTSGSGGGGGSGSSQDGEPITKTKYNIEVVGSSSYRAIIPISKETFDNYLVEMNQVGQTLATALGITWTTINDIDGLKDTFDDLKSTQLAYVCDLAMNLLVKYAYESGENPTRRILDFIGTIFQIIKYDLSSDILGEIISYSWEYHPLTDKYSSVNVPWFKTTPTDVNAAVTIDSSATFTYTSETETYGGSSSGSVTPQPTQNNLCYLVVSEATPANRLICMLDRNKVDSSAFVNTMNAGITQINTMFSINIPSYVTIDSLTSIADYLTSLNSLNYMLAKIVFYANVFQTIVFYGLTLKLRLSDGLATNATVYGLADDANQQYVYLVSYLDTDASPLAMTTLWSSPTDLDFTIEINELD